MNARNLLVALSLGLASVAFIGCEGEAEVDTATPAGEPVVTEPGVGVDREGIAEREGVIERETEQTGDAIEAGARETGQAIEGAAERTGQALEETGQEIQQEAEEAQQTPPATE